MMFPPRHSPPDSDRAEENPAASRLVLELYIAGTMPRSVQAVSDVRQICQRFFKGRYTLKVFDLTRNPQLAGARQILAVPTLIKLDPAPVRRLIGDFADPQRVAAALGVRTLDKVA